MRGNEKIRVSLIIGCVSLISFSMSSRAGYNDENKLRTQKKLGMHKLQVGVGTSVIYKGTAKAALDSM